MVAAYLVFILKYVYYAYSSTTTLVLCIVTHVMFTTQTKEKKLKIVRFLTRLGHSEHRHNPSRYAGLETSRKSYCHEDTSIDRAVARY